MPSPPDPIQRNFGAAAEDYARHRPGFPARLVELLEEQYALPHAPADALDLGTGTGTLARWWARQGYRVTGLDPDVRMLEAAAMQGEKGGFSMTWVRGTAEALPFPDQSFDLISAGQCWHWFEAPQACAEIRRCLRPGGMVVVAHYDWLPDPGSLAAATEALILKHNPQWQLGGGDGLHPKAAEDLRRAGFASCERVHEIVAQPFRPEDWRGRIRASVGIAASLDAAQVQTFDRELAALLAQDFPGEVLELPHRLDLTLAHQSPRPGSRFSSPSTS